jgi:hypothetical protein
LSRTVPSVNYIRLDGTAYGTGSAVITRQIDGRTRIRYGAQPYRTLNGICGLNSVRWPCTGGHWRFNDGGKLQ